MGRSRIPIRPEEKPEGEVLMHWIYTCKKCKCVEVAFLVKKSLSDLFPQTSHNCSRCGATDWNVKKVEDKKVGKDTETSHHV